MKKLDKYILSKDIHWPLFIHSDLFAAENIPNEIKESVNFLCYKLSFGYKGPFNDGFNPLVQLDGKRSCIYEDLAEDDFLGVKKIINITTNSFLLAKLNDVLFIKTSQIDYGKDAFENHKKCSLYYIELGKSFLATPFLKRSLYILLSLKEYKTISSYINDLADEKQYKDAHNYVIVINAIFSFLNECNYKKYKKEDLISKMEECEYDESDEGLTYIKNIIDHYSSIKDKEKANKWINKYADLCETLCENNSPHGYKYISKAIEMLSKFGEKNGQRINDLEFVLEEEQQKMFESMNFQSIPIEGEVNELINEHILQAQKMLIDEKDSINQFMLFLHIFKSVTENELISFSNEMDKSVFANLCNEIVFDKDKNVIDEIGPDDDEKRKKHNLAQGYQLFHSIYVPIAIKYLSCIVIDEKLLSLIRNIIEHNEFVPKSRADVVFNYIIDGLKKGIRQSVFNLMVQFEYGCSDFLRKKRVHPTIPAGSRRKNADLNHFLTMEQFRAPLKEVLGGDLTKELQYLLVDKQYGNLRNQDYHVGTERHDVCTNIEILAFFKLLNAYCMGYDETIN